MELKIEKYIEEGDTFYKLYTNDQYAFSINEEIYIKNRLYEKIDISMDELVKLENSMDGLKAKGFAVKLLARKLLTSNELVKKLIEKGFSKRAIALALEEVVNLGYLDDKRYVEKFIKERMKLKPKSKKLLSIELEAKGIDREIIEEALKDADIDDLETAENLVRKKFGKYNLNDEVIIKKLRNFMLARGYSYTTIMETINRIQGQ